MNLEKIVNGSGLKSSERRSGFGKIVERGGQLEDYL